MFVISCWFVFNSVLFLFFFKQKTAYEMRISDWSSDVCSSDLPMFATYLDRWALTPDGAPIATHSSDLLPVRHDGVPAMLKIARGAEEKWGGGLMVWRSEERRGGKEWVSPCRSRWSPYH